jgi:hypothetical protein
VAGKINFQNPINATVAGSIISMLDVPMLFQSKATINVSGSGATSFPAGLYFGGSFAPIASTYLELAP